MSGSSYIKLTVELKSPRKGLIKIKNNDQKCFLLRHVRHISSVKIHPERITREDKKLINSINVFCYENKLTFPIYVSDDVFVACNL